MSSSRRPYTAEFKQEAVLLVTKQGLSLAEAARRLEIHANLLRTWKQSLEKNGPQASPRQPTALETENARLRAGRSVSAGVSAPGDAANVDHPLYGESRLGVGRAAGE